MAVRQSLGLHAAPIVLRLVLCAIFLYAGYGKLFETMPVSGPRAAMLANLGVLPDSALPVRETPAPAETPPPSPQPPAPDQGPEEPASPDPESPDEATDASDGEPARASAGGPRIAVLPAQAPAGEPLYTADDFREPVEVSRRLGLVMLMFGANRDGDWPDALSSPAALTVLTWAAVLTEFVGAVLVLLGFLTRFWALGFVGTMIVAIWLTQMAPWFGEPDAFLGMLPPNPMGDPAEWTKAWQTLFYQLSVLGMSLALLLLGPGKLSLDALVFGKRSEGRAGEV